MGAVKATMSGITTERREKKQEGGWTCVRTIDRAIIFKRDYERKAKGTV